MSQPTLSLKVSDFQAEVGTFLGWGRGALFQDKPWTRDQTNRIHSCVKSGLRRFYYPPIRQGRNEVYTWSFLKPVANIAFPSGAKFVILPDDFGGPEGQLTISSSITQTVWSIPLTGIGVINNFYQITPTTVGRPLAAALSPMKGTTPTNSQQWQLWIYPITDQAYTFQLQYYLNPNYLTGDTPYAYGGPEHSETILEACLAVAEEREDDLPDGPHHRAFQERLATSIGMDIRYKPEFNGQNLDRSDWEGRWDREALHWLANVMYNGQTL